MVPVATLSILYTWKNKSFERADFKTERQNLYMFIFTRTNDLIWATKIIKIIPIFQPLYPFFSYRNVCVIQQTVARNEKLVKRVRIPVGFLTINYMKIYSLNEENLYWSIKEQLGHVWCCRCILCRMNDGVSSYTLKVC